MNNLQLSKNTSVFIYDVFGHIVIAQSLRHCEQSEAISANEQIASSPVAHRNDVLSIDVSTLPKGVYFVRVGSVVGKFVKE